MLAGVLKVAEFKIEYVIFIVWVVYVYYWISVGACFQAVKYGFVFVYRRRLDRKQLTWMI